MFYLSLNVSVFLVRRKYKMALNEENRAYASISFFFLKLFIVGSRCLPLRCLNTCKGRLFHSQFRVAQYLKDLVTHC